MKRTNTVNKHDAIVNRRVFADKSMRAAVGEYFYTDAHGKTHVVVLSNVGTRVRELNRNLEKVNRQIKARKTDVIGARELYDDCTTFDRRAAAVSSKPQNVASIRRHVLTAANSRAISERNSDRAALVKFANKTLRAANKHYTSAVNMRKTLLSQIKALNDSSNIILY